MKKFLSFIVLGLCTITLYAQGYRVDFHINDGGEFVRTDSDKNYYVFEYGTNLDAVELEKIFYNKWYELKWLPKYFDTFFRNSVYNKDNGTITGRTDRLTLQGFSEKVEFGFNFRLQFRDGRVRFDPPKIIPYINLQKVLPDEWIKITHDFENKQKASIRQKEIIDNIANNIINELLAYAEKVEEEWTNPQIVDDRNKQYFTLGNNFAFEFPNGANYAVYEFPGMSKEQLKMLIRDKFHQIIIPREEKPYYNYVNSSICDNGVDVFGDQNIPFSISFYRVDFHYKAYYACEDGLVKVFVPFIEYIYAYDPNRYYNSFKSLLTSASLCKKDGTHNKSGNKEESIQRITATFNFMIFAPLYYIRDNVYNKRAPAEKW